MTIKDIARESGYGVGTVSRVLNNEASVSEQAKEKILSVVDKYGFVLNQNAKLLKKQKRRTIAILVKGSSNMLFNSILEVIQKQIENLMYNAFVVVLDEYDNEAKVAYRIFYEQTPVGMIFLGGNPDLFKEDFVKIKAPSVLIANQAYDIDNRLISSISTDDIKASNVLTEFLIKNNHRKIAVIGGDLESSEVSRRRFKSFLDTLQFHNIPFDFEKQYVVSKYSFEDGYNSALKLLQKYSDVTAVFTMSDMVALGVIRAFSDKGLKVPQDISVTGFDGLSIAEFSVPRLATIRQLNEDLAKKGLDILISAIESESDIRQVQKLLLFEFVKGESVKKI